MSFCLSFFGGINTLVQCDENHADQCGGFRSEALAMTKLTYLLSYKSTSMEYLPAIADFSRHEKNLNVKQEKENLPENIFLGLSGGGTPKNSWPK